MSSSTPIQYAETAYRPDRIPQQPAPDKGTSALDHHLSVRLPWGYTEDVIPTTLFDGTEPENLIQAEKELAIQKYGRGEFDEQFDHICIRPASLSRGTQFWNIMYQIGRGALPLTTIVMLIVLCIGYFKFGRGLVALF